MLKETKEQKEIRLFNFYKKDFEKLSKEGNFLRFICIDYVCRFPEIDPYKMAATLSAEGIKIIFDDSTINAAKNKGKKRKVKKLIA